MINLFINYFSREMKIITKQNSIFSTEEIKELFFKIDKSFCPKFTSKKIVIKHFPTFNHYKKLKNQIFKHFCN